MYFTLLLLVACSLSSRFSLAAASVNLDANGSNDAKSIKIAKCCEPEELRLDDTCVPLSETNETERWWPEFVKENDEGTAISKSAVPDYQLQIGLPRCNSNAHQSHVYHNPSGSDRLAILPSGKLRHYTDDFSKISKGQNAYDDSDNEEVAASMHYDYPFAHYCIDKVILSRDHMVTTYAMVCVPTVVIRWTDTDYLMRHAIDPTFHAIAIVCYLVVAIVYVVLPQLRDLVGNMITTMTLCLITSLSASIVRIFTELGSHVSFLIADSVTYIALLGAFFWLNALGYYVWNTFRSRNVFLRVTDGKKYFYYSSYVWGSTILIAATAIFAHFALEMSKPVVGGTTFPAQETVGWLAISVLFTSIAFTIIVDLCFVLTTASRIKRMSTYGRIHHKMKYSFRMFLFLFIVMSIGWLSLLFSRLKYDIFVYCHIIINLLQAVLILYICVFGQRRVTFLLSKTCNCCNSPVNVEGLDWGEEMTAINAGY